MKLTFKTLDPDTTDTVGEKKGFVIFTIEAYLEEKKLGYIKISLLSKENFKRACPTPWHFLREWEGKIQLSPEALDNPSDIYDALCGSTKMWGYESQSLPTAEKIKRLAQFEFKILDLIQERTRTLINSPYVDYIKVEEGSRRLGIGTLLYAEAAKLMQSKGYALRSSTLQSAEAFSAWESLEKKGLAEKSGDFFIFKNIE
jgi:GNAT superfamily N-acetyltransferase